MWDVTSDTSTPLARASRMPKDIHDNTFKELVAERSFFIPLLKAHLPVPLTEKMAWDSVELYKSDGSHIQEKTGRRRFGDVLYLVRLKETDENQTPILLWLHLEHLGR